jgi:methionyl aminopeptidase
MRYSLQADHGKRIPLHDEAGFAAMRRVGRVAADTLDMIAPHVKPGISTAELDALCEAYMRQVGSIPATIGYNGYQHASCISVNHVVTHGIPSNSKYLREGDIVNIDVSPLLGGWHGDTSRTFQVGAVSILAERLVKKAYEAMFAGINAVRPGATLGDVGAAIEAVARAQGFSTVRDFCGHGIGQVFHDAPQVLHYGRAGTGVVLEPGMIFTIEPMLNAGGHHVKVLRDEWTTVTKDHSLSAQFEHTVAVTDIGVEIFTLSAAERTRLTPTYDAQVRASLNAMPDHRTA